VPQKAAMQRMQSPFLLYRKGEQAHCITGVYATRKAQELGIAANQPAQANNADKRVKGIAASAGSATGIARIVKNASHLGKVGQGDVIIAVTTNPVYLPAMGKACAFVTDEGGLTCHAAIIAREMRKPCVAGTKNATKTFAEGDKVRVDGTKGVAEAVQ
jgi:pyruvate,water dikinase